MQERLLSYKETMDLCGVKSRTTIYEWVKRGILPPPVKLRPGAKAPVKFKHSEIMAYIESLPAQHY